MKCTTFLLQLDPTGEESLFPLDNVSNENVMKLPLDISLSVLILSVVTFRWESIINILIIRLFAHCLCLASCYNTVLLLHGIFCELLSQILENKTISFDLICFSFQDVLILKATAQVIVTDTFLKSLLHRKDVVVQTKNFRSSLFQTCVIIMYLP